MRSNEAATGENQKAPGHRFYRVTAQLESAGHRLDTDHVGDQLSTSIFIRMAAEATIGQLNEGVAIDKVSPFWRLIEPDSKIAQRLSVDKHWIDAQRSQEGT